MRSIIALLTCSAALSASGVDPREIVKRSIEAENRNAREQQAYTYMQKAVEKRLDASGQVKSTDTTITKVVVINGGPFEQQVEHNGQPVSGSEAQKQQDKLLKQERETPEERARRQQEWESKRAFMQEIPAAFDFKLLGEENIQGRPAWMLEATPRPGYQPRDKNARMFANVRGRFWVDEQDYTWVKIEAQVTSPFSMGPLGVAKVQKGSRITYEQTRVAEGIWFPKLIEVSADAKILFLKNYNMDAVISFWDYRKVEPATLSASR